MPMISNAQTGTYRLKVDPGFTYRGQYRFNAGWLNRLEIFDENGKLVYKTEGRESGWKAIDYQLENTTPDTIKTFYVRGTHQIPGQGEWQTNTLRAVRYPENTVLPPQKLDLFFEDSQDDDYDDIVVALVAHEQ